MFIQKLKQNKINEKNRVYIAADFETILVNQIHYVYMIGEAFSQKHKIIKNKLVFKYSNIDLNDDKNIINNSYLLIEKFIRNIISKNKKTKKVIVYFHNLGNFDGYFIVKAVNRRMMDLKKSIVIRDNKIYKINIENITFLDSINMINESLDNIGKTFLNEGKYIFDISKIKKLEDIKKNYNELVDYLRRDVYLLYNFISMWKNKMIEMFNIDIVKYFTISSISLAIYRRDYLKNYQNIEITKGYKFDFIKRSYFGGITNVFKTELKKGFCYDVNSLYPYIMKSTPMPLGKGEYIYSKDASIEKFNEYYGFCECLINIPKDIPIPPLIHRKDDVVLMPVGIVKGIWHTDEINFAIQKGCKIIKIYKVVNYKEKKIIFNDIISDIYIKRIESKNNIENKIYKLIMNSLYGRFGMDIEKSNTLWDLDELTKWSLEQFSEVSHKTDYNEKDVLENNNLFTYKIDPQRYQNLISSDNISIEDKENMINSFLKFKNKYQTISSIQIASTITANARIYMLKIMYDIIKKGGKVYYTDTDSIFTNIELDDKYVSDYEIGKFKKEYDIEKAVFLASKVYCCVKSHKKNIFKFKGLKNINENNLTYELYKEKLKKDSFYKIVNVERNFVKNYNKMTISKNIVDMKFSFDSLKYNKIYVNDKFDHTKPIYINDLDIEDLISNEMNMLKEINYKI